MSKHYGVKCLNYVEWSGLKWSLKVRTHTDAIIRNGGTVYPWVADGPIWPVNVASETFPFSHSSLLILLFVCPPSLCLLTFSSVFYCCEAQRCLLTNPNILAGAKIQHLQAMQTSVDLAKARMIKGTFYLFYFIFCSLPLRLSWMPSLDSTLRTLLYPSLPSHSLSASPALSCFSLSLMTVLSSLSHLSLSAWKSLSLGAA